MLALWTVYQIIELHVVTFRLGGRLDPLGGVGSRCCNEPNSVLV